jgi:beta-phosphoglucomutase
MKAVIFDLNGTLSDDEPLIERIYLEALAELGAPIDARTYAAELTGLAEPEMIERGLRLGDLEPTDALRETLLRMRLDRYRDAVAGESTISAATAALVRDLAHAVPVALASGALREEVDAVLAKAGLSDVFAAIVTIDDVAHGKPDPASFELALERMVEATGVHLTPEDVVVVEDSDPGVAAARAAGMPCVRVTGDVEAVIAGLVAETRSRA